MGRYSQLVSQAGLGGICGAAVSPLVRSAEPMGKDGARHCQEPTLELDAYGEPSLPQCNRGERRSSYGHGGASLVWKSHLGKSAPNKFATQRNNAISTGILEIK